VSEGGGESLSDGALIRESLRQPEVFRAIFERHAPSVLRYLSKRVPMSTVEDLVSEIFVIAFQNRHRYDHSNADARPWLFGIATNVMRHHRRSERRLIRRLSRMSGEPEQEDVSDAVISDVMGSIERTQVREALAKLDDRYRDVLMLIAGPGLTYEEISTALGIPVGTVRSRVFRGRRLLRELLELQGQHDRDRTRSEVRSGSEGDSE
jgi:RNA polymerase sigma factor (sigma-70 family)